MSCLRLKDGHRVHLAIIGGDPSASPQEMSAEMARLQKLCDDLCVGQTVVFLGKRDQDRLPYYYSAAELLVMRPIERFSRASISGSGHQLR